MTGTRIREARLAKGWTQDDLAQAVRVKRPHLRLTGVYVSRYERNVQQPRLDILEGIAEATERSLDFFRAEAAAADDDEETSLLSAAHALDVSGAYAMADKLRAIARRRGASLRTEVADR